MYPGLCFGTRHVKLLANRGFVRLLAKHVLSHYQAQCIFGGPIMDPRLLQFLQPGATPIQALLMVVMAVVLFRNLREQRRLVVNTMLLYFFGLAGQFVTGLLLAFGVNAGAEGAYDTFAILTGIAMIRIGGKFVFSTALPLLGLRPPRIAEDIFVIFGYIAWIMIRLRYAGLEVGHLVTTSAVLTAVIGLSMQDTLVNILGGVLLNLENSFTIGDWIKVDDQVGQVVDIQWRSTTIETRNWESVVIPNAQLMKSKFIVLGKKRGQPRQWRRWVWFNVEASHAPGKVINLVDGALRQANIATMAQNPPANCLIMSFESGYNRYAARYWLNDLLPDDPSDSMVRSHIHAALEREGISMALTQQAMYMVQDNAKREKRLKAQQVNQHIGVLRRIDLFAPFSDEELHMLADKLVYAPYLAGDVITRQGNHAQWLYILESGMVDVVRETADNQRIPLNRLGADSIFGEMSLMTGDPRMATVVAASDAVCYRLDKASFETILLSRPQVVEELTAIMVERQSLLDQANLQGDEAARNQDGKRRHAELITRVRRFFGLENAGQGGLT